MIKVVLFDFGGTLFWLDLDWDKYFDLIKNPLQSLDSKTYNSYLNDSITWNEMQNRYVQKYGQKALNLFWFNNSQAELKLFKKSKPNHTLITLLRSLTDNFTLYIWSSNTPSLIKNLLNAYYLDKRFAKIVTRLDVAFLKPNPEGFLNHIYDRSVSKNHYLMIGNSQADRLAAHQAGIDFYLAPIFN